MPINLSLLDYQRNPESLFYRQMTGFYFRHVCACAFSVSALTTSRDIAVNINLDVYDKTDLGIET